MSKDTGIPIKNLKVDGGASRNNFLMQFQADVANCRVVRGKINETTALGAAYLAGMAVGEFKSLQDVKGLEEKDKIFRPKMDPSLREKYMHKWHKAVKMCQGWEDEN
jgi:glycerol kinase